MPSLTFILPHSLYWAGLLLFPFLAMYLVRREKRFRSDGAVSVPLAYLFLIGGGYVGLHRFYARNLLGIVYIPLFLAILFANVEGREARDGVSQVRAEVLVAEFDLEEAQAAVAQAADGATEMLAQAERTMAALQQAMNAATASFDFWNSFAGAFGLAIAVLLLIDAFLVPRLVRRCAQTESTQRAAESSEPAVPEVALVGTHEAASLKVHTKITDVIDAISSRTGEYVCYWSVIAVLVYYYEVLARYVFNSPTNWAHESMYLMFGMMYLIAGAFGLHEDQHVRVDIIYSRLSDRGKALADVVTSTLFFIFTGALLVSGWVFTSFAVGMWEVSFTEWAVQYWAVKATIVIGSVLIILQGLSKLVKDLRILLAMEG